jgi:hypothetical protein
VSPEDVEGPEGPEATALAWARARSAGPLPSRPGAGVPAGMIRLAEPDGSGAWLVPQVPESADARVLAELGLAGPLLEQPNETARMLAACLRCCWADPLTPPWPGRPAASADVLAVFREVTGPRDDAAHRRSAVAALRRLHQAGWVLRDEPAGTVRLGPRVALWSTSDLSTLRQLWRSMPDPDSERVRALPPGQSGAATGGGPDEDDEIEGPDGPDGAGEEQA